jgi:nucleotide-binding universal stress UspA family protein
MYRSIMVPLDGSQAAEHALPLAISIARRAGASLQLTHVHDPARPMFMDAVSLFDDRRDAKYCERERIYLDDLANRLMRCHRLAVTTRLLDGAAADTIALYALASCVDLVVMTTHGRGTQVPVWLGSVADELVHWTPTPLLLIQPYDRAPDLADEPLCRQALIVLGGSIHFEQQLAHPIALGTLLRAEYTLLYVVEPGHAADRTLPNHRTARRALEQQRCRAQAYLDRIAARLRAEALHVRIRVVVGAPVAAVLEYAQEHAVDLISMGRYHPRVAEQLLGRADQMLWGMSVPLLLYHPRQAAGGAEIWREREVLAGI